jgi:predicted MFS family arabinose efflux permease
MIFSIFAVLGPLRLHQLGLSDLGVGGVFFVSAGIAAALNPALGRWCDRRGRLQPLRATLIACILLCPAVPLVAGKWGGAVIAVAAGVVFDLLFVPATALFSDGSEAAGLDPGLGFALFNLAWSPGGFLGAAAGGALAGVVGNASPYLVAAALCGITLAVMRGRGPNGPEIQTT